MRLRIVVADIDIRLDTDADLAETAGIALQLLAAAASIERVDDEPEPDKTPLGFTMTSELDPDRHDRNLGEPMWDED